MEVYVHLDGAEKAAGSVVANTLGALRDKIKAKFSDDTRKFPAPDKLIVQVKAAENKLRPLENDAELELDGAVPCVGDKYRVYVEVPKVAAAGTILLPEFGFVPSKLLILNEANQPITTDLKRGDLVRVRGTETETNERDEKNKIDKRALWISQPLLDFLKFFWGHYDKGVKEFNIMGASGVGKSCAVKILAAEISRKRPDITLFYLRDGVDDELA